MTKKNDKDESDSLLSTIKRLTGQVAGGTLDAARNTAAMTAMFGDNWLRSALVNSFDPERLEAMAEAGHFLRDARETAGMSLKDLGESLGLSDNSVLEDIESGTTIMPLELMLRSASLLARHDPIPFLIKFMRTYNPALEKTLEQWGVMAIPKQYERERRFVNLYRKHDVLRALSDDEYDRFISYMQSSSELVLDVMTKEKAAAVARAGSGGGAKSASTAKKASASKTAGKVAGKAPAKRKRTVKPKAKAPGRR